MHEMESSLIELVCVALIEPGTVSWYINLQSI